VVATAEAPPPSSASPSRTHSLLRPRLRFCPR
jgi:hypothetical protein